MKKKRTGPILGLFANCRLDEPRIELRKKIELLFMYLGLEQQGETRRVVSPCKGLELEGRTYRGLGGIRGRNHYYIKLRLATDDTPDDEGFLPSLDLRPRNLMLIGGDLRYPHVDGTITVYEGHRGIVLDLAERLTLPYNKLLTFYNVREPQRILINQQKP